MIPRMQPTSQDEIRNLLGIVERDLQQTELAGLHADNTFGFLYNAALQLATIIIRLRGERFGGAGHHRNTLLRIREIVPPDLEPLAAALEHARRKRNASIYDQAGVVTQADIAGLKDAIAALKPWVIEQAQAYLAKSESR